jgi:uncharacterized protein (TIGR00661 family)
MKILIGVCGIGNGHSMRQASVVRELLVRDHRLAMVGWDASLAFFQRHYPGIPRFEVTVPWLPGNLTGLDFTAAARDERNRAWPGWVVNATAYDGVLGALGGPPDLILTDYCSPAAELGYATHCPVVTIDNQSKFLGYQFPDLAGYSRNEERARLALFFPRAAARVAVSFFRIDWPRDPLYDVTVIPPFVRPEFRAAAEQPIEERRQILVYMSPLRGYEQSAQTIEEILAELRRVRSCQFVLFTSDAPPATVDNVTVRGFDFGTFLLEMKRSMGVVCNGGSNVLREALLLGKPLLVMPFSTYEQQCNADVAARNGMALVARTLDAAVLERFLDGLERMKAAIHRDLSSRSGVIEKGDGLPRVISFLGERFGV